ncbi:MAG: DUF4870 domain-containing protein [Candidatus Omnitrophica bacterium]|nr:DUF4870 domain-containing protein [Candidatus Omnitrophota bacterium]
MSNENLGKTSVGIQANIEAFLCYLGGFITGIIFYIVEKENKFVRFHAVQSTVTFGGLFIVNLASRLILPGALYSLISLLVGILSLILWVVLMVKAYSGEKYKLPIAGEVAEEKSK